MSLPLPSSHFVLHIWPGRWDLPSIDPWCIAAVLYLQLALPGKFSIAECTNSDLSPSGQLPFMTHEQQVVSPLSSIVKYVAGLMGGGIEKNSSSNLDAALDSSEKSQKLAWCAHIESNLGDMVSHMFYALDENWSKLIHPTLASMLPIPQRYYVPGRLRDLYRPRLEASGLWGLPGIEQEENKPFNKENLKPREEANQSGKFFRVFEREKVLEKARSSLDIYARLLGEKRFFFHDHPTTLDIILGAHILLLLNPPFPDPLLKILLRESYPTLVNHAQLVCAKARESNPEIPTSPAQRHSLWSLVPRSAVKQKEKKEPEGRSDEDLRFDRMRWAWIGFAVGSVALYFFHLRIRLAILNADNVKSERGEGGERKE